MTRHTLAAGTICTALAIVGAAPALAGSDEDAIRDLWTTYESLVVSGDGETWLTLWDADGIQLPPGEPMHPKAELDQVVPATWDDSIADAMEISPMEIVVMGDMAYSMGTYTIDYTGADGQAEQIDGKFMTLLRRQEDGSWRIYRDIFNSNR